jgi:hypothetical protein
MDINISSTTSDVCIDTEIFHKMRFIYNALEDGWTVSAQNNKYVFTKKHENKKEIYLENYLKNFIEKNIDINNLIN